MLAIYLSMIESEEGKSKFENLYLSYRQLMYYIANDILKDDYEAEDAVQQSFLRIVENIDKFPDPPCEKAKGLAVIITRRISIDIYRKRKKRATVSLDGEDWPDENTAAYQEELNDALEKALLLLPDMYAETIKLKFFYEYSILEISEILGISESNVKQRIFRGKQKLKEILEGLEGA